MFHNIANTNPVIALTATPGSEPWEINAYETLKFKANILPPVALRQFAANVDEIDHNSIIKLIKDGSCPMLIFCDAL